MKVTLGSKRERANQVNKDPGLTLARKSLHRVDYINGAISPRWAEVRAGKDGKGHESSSVGTWWWSRLCTGVSGCSKLKDS